jgi:antitoxin component YwqK of YwqJK toxin-antitoxin module
MNKITTKFRRYVTTMAAIFILTSVWGKILNGQDSLNITDAKGWKQGHWIILNDSKHLPGYSDKEKVEEGNYKDNLKQGIWIQYFPGGLIKNKITFKDNRPDGYTVTYFENGKVNEEGIWRNNRWVGNYRLNYENGNVQHEFHYSEGGKRDSNNKYYYPNGKLMIDGSWVNGKQAGVTTEYYDDGTIKAKEIFNDGNLDPSQSQTFAPKSAKTTDVVNPVITDAPKQSTTIIKTDETTNLGEKAINGEGKMKLYNKNKQLVKDGIFHNYQLVYGKEYIYNKDGILQKIAVYKGGVYQGDAPITEEDKK